MLRISPRTMGRQDKFCLFELYPWSKVYYFYWAFVLKRSLEAPWLLRPWSNPLVLILVTTVVNAKDGHPIQEATQQRPAKGCSSCRENRGLGAANSCFPGSGSYNPLLPQGLSSQQLLSESTHSTELRSGLKKGGTTVSMKEPIKSLPVYETDPTQLCR